MCSSGVWISAMPFARLTHGEAALVEDVRVGGAAGEREARLRGRCASSAAHGEPDDLVGSRLKPVAAVALAHLRLDLALARAGRERDRVEHLLHEVARACASSCERASASNVHHSGTMFPAVPPVIVPTFAVVSSSIRPSRRSAIARAAAAIAERPSSGYMPACDARPWKRTSIACACGAPRMTSPIGAAWS